MKRNSAWVAALVLATAGAITGGANAFGADVTGPGTGPVTASEHYAKDMSFQEVSKASQGKPGEVAPPCPAASLVIKLKASGLPVGPCDPLPESGAPITLSDDSASDTATAAKDSCAVTYVGSTTAKGVKQIEGTCRSGAVILSSFGHWDDNEPGFPRGYAYIHDMTPAAWPVFTAAIDWDQAPKLDLVYRSGGSSCTSSHCVPFRAVALGGAGCSASPASPTSRCPACTSPRPTREWTQAALGDRTTTVSSSSATRWVTRSAWTTGGPVPRAACGRTCPWGTRPMAMAPTSRTSARRTVTTAEAVVQQ